MKYLIRADASNEIGTGHVMRCIALGQMLIDDGHEVSFLTQTENESLRGRIKSEGFGLFCFREEDNIEDAKYTIKVGKDIKANWIVTDGYKFKTEYQKRIKESGFKLMCIDDVCECHYVSDIVLNQNLNAEILYKYSCEDYTKLLLGIKYVLLRREFKKVKERDANDECNNILITFGGSDPKNLTNKVLEYFRNNNKDAYNLRVIIGANADLNEENSIENRSGKKKIEVYKNVENILEQMEWADLAITAAGSTIWELIAANTPFIHTAVAENQINVAKEVASKLKASVFNDFEEFGEVFNNSLEYKYRSDLNANMKNFKTENGYVNNDLKSVLNDYKVRKATIGDIKDVFDLSNEPVVRENSINQTKIDWEEHEKWFGNKINSNECQYYVVYSCSNDFIGQVRFDIDEKKNSTVSISITEAYRGKKLSHLVLKSSCEKYFEEVKDSTNITAYIKPNNIPSVRIFEKAGFMYKDKSIINSIEFLKLIFIRKIQLNDRYT